jgi:hypothetical protein
MLGVGPQLFSPRKESYARSLRGGGDELIRLFKNLTYGFHYFAQSKLNHIYLNVQSKVDLHTLILKQVLQPIANPSMILL